MSSIASRASDLILSIISRTEGGGGLPRCVTVRLLSASSRRSRSTCSISSVTASGRMGRRRMRETVPDSSASLMAQAEESENATPPDGSASNRRSGSNPHSSRIMSSRSPLRGLSSTTGAQASTSTRSSTSSDDMWTRWIVRRLWPISVRAPVRSGRRSGRRAMANPSPPPPSLTMRTNSPPGLKTWYPACIMSSTRTCPSSHTTSCVAARNSPGPSPPRPNSRTKRPAGSTTTMRALDSIRVPSRR